jgi:hypothetical protein
VSSLRMGRVHATSLQHSHGLKMLRRARRGGRSSGGGCRLCVSWLGPGFAHQARAQIDGMSAAEV